MSVQCARILHILIPVHSAKHSKTMAALSTQSLFRFHSFNRNSRTKPQLVSRPSKTKRSHLDLDIGHIFVSFFAGSCFSPAPCRAGQKLAPKGPTYEKQKPLWFASYLRSPMSCLITCRSKKDEHTNTYYHKPYLSWGK